MEDKRISEKESLELIARMIRETQDNTARYLKDGNESRTASFP